MANPEIKQTLKQSDYKLKDLLDLAKQDIFLSLFAHHIGEIQSFDKDKQTVKATIKYKRTFFEQQAGGIDPVPVLKDYPPLIDVPVIVIGGGGFNMTFPIAKGDECILIFNDRSIDNWFQSGQVGAVSSPRAHSVSDAIALVGLQNLTRLITGYDASRASLRNKANTVRMGVGASKLHFQNSGTSLLATLTQLRLTLTTMTTALQTLTTAMSGANAGNIPATIAAPSAAATIALTTAIANLTTAQANLDSLMETVP